MRHAACFLFAVLALGAAPAHAVGILFLCSSQLPGESTSAIAPGCIEVSSASEAVFVEAGAAEPRDLRFTKYVDTSSQPLRRFMVTATRVTQATLQQFKQTAAAQPQMYTHVRMLDVEVTSLATEFTEDASYETVSLRPARVEYMYRKQNPQDGSLGSPVYQCWDRARRTVTTAQCP